MGCCAQIVLTPRARLNPPNDDKAHSVVRYVDRITLSFALL